MDVCGVENLRANFLFSVSICCCRCASACGVLALRMLLMAMRSAHEFCRDQGAKYPMFCMIRAYCCGSDSFDDADSGATFILGAGPAMFCCTARRHQSSPTNATELSPDARSLNCDSPSRGGAGAGNCCAVARRADPAGARGMHGQHTGGQHARRAWAWARAHHLPQDAEVVLREVDHLDRTRLGRQHHDGHHCHDSEPH